jgi:hypothetical protein
MVTKPPRWLRTVVIVIPVSATSPAKVAESGKAALETPK